jgi:hypothetical protein
MPEIRMDRISPIIMLIISIVGIVMETTESMERVIAVNTESKLIMLIAMEFLLSAEVPSKAVKSLCVIAVDNL